MRKKKKIYNFQHVKSVFKWFFNNRCAHNCNKLKDILQNCNFLKIIVKKLSAPGNDICGNYYLMAFALGYTPQKGASDRVNL